MARLRHPEHALRDARAAQRQRLARAGDVGHHGRSLAAEQAQQGILRRLDEQAGHGQQPKGQQRLRTALECGHAAAHFVHALDGVGDADGQHQRHQAEMVAQLPGLFHGAQIHRDHGADLLALGGIPMAAQIVADGPGHAGQQHVIDRAVQRLANGLDLVQRQGRAPGHALGVAGDALEQRGRVVRHEGQCGRVADELVAQAGRVHRSGQAVLHGFFGVEQHVQRFGGAVAHQVECLHGHAREGLDQRVGNPVLGVGGGLLTAFGGLCTAVHQRHGHRDQGNPVGNAVVQAHHQCAARLAVVAHKIFHQIEVPQRAPRIERLHRQVAHEILQRRLLADTAAPGQRDALHMGFDVKALVLDPGGTGGVFDHALAKAWVLQQALLHTLLQGFERDTGCNGPHPVDHHQVAARIHAQPGGIDLAHALARQAQHAGGGAAHVFLHSQCSIAGGGARAGVVCRGSGRACGGAGRDAGHHVRKVLRIVIGGRRLRIFAIVAGV